MHGDHSLRRNCLPDAERLEERDVARAEGVDAGIEALARKGLGTLLRDERDREAARGAREAYADRTAADDDEIMVLRAYNRGFDPWRISSAG